MSYLVGRNDKEEPNDDILNEESKQSREFRRNTKSVQTEADVK